MAPLHLDSLILTGAASIAARPLLHALLRRRFAAVQLCAELPELADLHAHLSAWCEAQGLPTALHLLAEEPESSSAVLLPSHGWLIHGNPCHAEALLQLNVCTALRSNIRVIPHRLKALPDCGVDFFPQQSPGGAPIRHHRLHSHCCRSSGGGLECVPSRCNRAGVAAPGFLRCRAGVSRHAPELNAAWQRKGLAEAFVDALAAAQPGGYLVDEAVHRPREPGAGVARAATGALRRLRRDSARRGLEGLRG